MEGHASCTHTHKERVLVGSAGTALSQASPGTLLTNRAAEGV